jgi:hypothetical protein
MSITNIDTSIRNLRDRLEAIKTAGEYHKLTPILSQISRVIDSRRDKTEVTLYLFEKLDQLLLHYKSIIIEWLNDQFEHSMYGGLEGLDILKNSIGLDWQELDNWVNNHKQLIVKQLILGMKLNDFNSVITDIEELRRLNVSWPELDIFEKPARDEQRRIDFRYVDDDEDDYIDDHDLHENDIVSRRIENAVQYLLSTGQVDVSVRHLEDQGLHDSRIVEVLSPHAKQIVDKITEHKRMPPYAVYELILLLQIGARWPELINAVVNNKHAVIKYLLNDFKENYSDDVMLDSLNRDLERLKSFGINWKELGILETSVIDELKTRGLYDDRTPLAEAQPVIPPKIVKQFEREYSNIHKSGVSAIWETVVHLKEIGATDQQIASLLSERREQVAQTIRNSLHNVSPTSFNTINEAMYVIYELLSVGIKWPLLLQLLDRYKDKITAWAIAGATDSHFGSIIADRLVAFEKLGFDTADIRQKLKANVSPNVLQFLYRQGFGWNAQNKIQTLAKLNLLPIAFNDKEVDDILSVFIDYVVNHAMTNAVYDTLVKLIPNETDKIKQTFEKNKAAIVKSMLTSIKSQYAPSIVATLHILHKLNIKWPEMRIITTSMKAGK